MAVEELEKEALPSPVTDLDPPQNEDNSTSSDKEKSPGQNQENAPAVLERSGTRASSLLEYSIFSKDLKRYIVFTSSWAGFFSPLSSQIYFPALNTMAADLHVSISLINLTLTSYMVSGMSRPPAKESSQSGLIIKHLCIW
jgi:hypothetical protein